MGGGVFLLRRLDVKLALSVSDIKILVNHLIPLLFLGEFSMNSCLRFTSSATTIKS